MARYDLNITPSYVPSMTDPVEAAGSRLQTMIAGLKPPTVVSSGTSGPLYSPTKRAFFINGREVSERDEAGLLQAAKEINPNVSYQKPEGDWTQVDRPSFDQLVGKIANPDFMTRMGKSFESGVAGSGELAGAALTFAGLKEPGLALMEASQRRQQELSPYSTQFSDIGKDPTVDVFDWVASTVGQLGPSIIETLATTAIGAVAGGAAGGGPNPITAAGGALAGLTGKTAFKAALVQAAKAYEKEVAGNIAKGMAQDLAKKTAVQALKNTAEGKVLRSAGAIAGGAIFNTANSYLTGIGDITADQLSAGVDPDKLNRLGIAGVGAPLYAALESFPDAILAARVFGEASRGAKSLARSKGMIDRAKRFISGTLEQGTLEGATEAGQESILMASNPLTDWDSPDVVSRLTNSFAAGALMGGLMGGPANLLNRGKTESDEAQVQGQTQAQPEDTQTFPMGDMQGPNPQLMLPAPAGGAPIAGMLPPPIKTNFYADASGNVSPSGYGEAVDPTASLMLPAPPPAQPYVPGPSVLYASPTGQVQIPGQAPTTGPNPFVAPAVAQRPSMLPRQTAPIVPFASAVNAGGMARITGPNPQTEGQAPAGAYDVIPFYADRISALPTVQQEALLAKLEKEPNPLKQRTILEKFFKAKGIGKAKGTGKEKLKKVAPMVQAAPAPAPAAPVTPTPAPTTPAPSGFANVPPVGTKPAAPARNATVKSNTGQPLKQGTTVSAQSKALLNLGYLGSEIAKMTSAQAAEIIKNKTTPTPRTPVQAFRDSFASRGSADIRRNPELTQLADLVDYLGSLTDAQWKKLEGKFTSGDNPYLTGLNPNFDIAATRAKVEAIVSPKAKAVTKGAAAKPADNFRNEAGAATAAESITPTTPKETVNEGRKPTGKGVAGTRTRETKPVSARTATDVADNGASVRAGDSITDTGGPTPIEALENIEAAGRKQAKEAMPDVSEAVDADAALVTLIERLNQYVDDFLFGTSKNHKERAAKRTEILNDLADKAMAGDKTLIPYLRSQMTGEMEWLGSYMNAEGKFAYDENNDLVYDETFHPSPRTNFRRVDGKPNETISVKQAELFANEILKKFAVKPNLFVYKNVADFKARNPALFAKAKAGRFDENLDGVNAAGYSFGRNVVLFSDAHPSSEALRFTMLHETLGHFGLRAVVPQAQLDNVLNEIYDADPVLRAYADRHAEMYGTSKSEAIEEVLADSAATLDDNIVKRVWAVLKNFLNKLGFKFRDDIARSLLFQSRRYVRTGWEGGAYVGVEHMVQNLARMDTESNTGRYNLGRTKQDFNHISLAQRYGGNKTWQQVFSDARAMNVNGQGVRSLGGDIRAVFETVTSYLKTIDDLAMRSDGASHVSDVIRRRADRVKTLQTEYDEFYRPIQTGDANHKPLTNKQFDEAGELLSWGTLHNEDRLTDEQIAKMPNVVSYANGEYRRNDAAIAAALRQVLITPDEFAKGILIKDNDGSPITKKFAQAKNKEVYNAYVRMATLQAQASADVAVSVYRRAAGVRNSSMENALKTLGGPNPSQKLREALRQINDTYTTISLKGSRVVDNFVRRNNIYVAQADKLLKEAIRVASKENGEKKWADWERVREAIRKGEKVTLKPGETAETAFDYASAEYLPLINALEELRGADITNTAMRRVNDSIASVIMQDIKVKDAELYAKRSILMTYAPLIREGKYDVFLVARNRKGELVKLAENVLTPRFSVSDMNEVTDYTNQLSNLFVGDKANPQVWELDDIDGNKIEVTFEAHSREASEHTELPGQMNFYEVFSQLETAGVTLYEQQREQLIKAYTSRNASARRGLKREGNPGWDTNVIGSIAKHVNRQANIIATNEYRWQIDEFMNSLNNNAWLGDRDKLARLKARVDALANSPNRAAHQVAKAEYERYAFQMVYMQDQGSPDIEVNGKKVKTRGLGRVMQGQMREYVEFLEGKRDIVSDAQTTVFDYAAGKLKGFTAATLLGASPSFMVINMTSLATNSLPYLAYHNSKNGYGIGVGLAKAVQYMTGAFSDVASPKFGKIETLERAVKGEWKTLGLRSQLEAVYLLNSAKDGTNRAALTNFLMGQVNGERINPKLRKVIDAWLSPFSYSEQLNRRTTGLSVYRAVYDRNIAAKKGAANAADIGKAELEAHAAASEAAEHAVNRTQGNYDVHARPRLFRSSLMQVLMMFKLFQIVSIQNMKNMDARGRIFYLGAMIAFAGVMGLPFAEDIEDLIDSLSRMFGIPVPSARLAMENALNDMMPGLGELVARGPMDKITNLSISSRMGQGDLIPLTGLFVPGRDQAREWANAAGPVFSTVSNVMNTALGVGSLTLETLGLRQSGATDLQSIIRESPSPIISALGDAWAYLESGGIVTKDGRLVSKDLNAYTIIARAIGFYPLDASQNADVVRMGRQVGEYAKEVKATFLEAYVKANMKNDRSRMEEIRRRVRQWNSSVNGTGLEVKDFSKAVERAMKSAKQTSGERFLKASSTTLRPLVQQMLEVRDLTP